MICYWLNAEFIFFNFILMPSYGVFFCGQCVIFIYKCLCVGLFMTVCTIVLFFYLQAGYHKIYVSPFKNESQSNQTAGNV